MRGTMLRIAAALIAALAALPANAQTYPDRPVKIVLPFGAGGVADVSSRIVAEKLGDKLGQRFVIENMPGAGGISAANAVLTAPPDGYTLGLVTNGTAISAAHLQEAAVRSGDAISTMISHARHVRSRVRRQCGVRRTRRLRDFVAAAKARARQAQRRHHQCRRHAASRRGAASRPPPASTCRSCRSAIRRTSWSALLRDDVQMLVDFPRRGERPGRRRQAAPARDLRPEALALDAEPADRRGGRRRGLRGDVVERHVRAAWGRRRT